MKHKIITIICAFVAACFCTNAQQDMMLSQEIFSRINKNPAGTGNNETIDLFLHGRLQWVGVDNAPKSTVLNVTNYCERIKSGMGISLSYDKMGIGHHTTNTKAVYAYHIDLNSKTILALGLAAGANFTYFNPLVNTVANEVEYGMETYPQNKETKTTPDFDFGFELSQQNWTVGASVTHLQSDETTTYQAMRHFYVYATSLLPINDKWDVSPTITYMHRNQTDVLEVGSYAFYDRTYWGGITCRPDLYSEINPSMIVFTVGLEWSRYRFGYSYDLGLGSCSKLPSNTHEIIISASIDKKKKAKLVCDYD